MILMAVHTQQSPEDMQDEVVREIPTRDTRSVGQVAFLAALLRLQVTFLRGAI